VISVGDTSSDEEEDVASDGETESESCADDVHSMGLVADWEEEEEEKAGKFDNGEYAVEEADDGEDSLILHLFAGVWVGFVIAKVNFDDVEADEDENCVESPPD
jgi:hypothetical protein